MNFVPNDYVKVLDTHGWIVSLFSISSKEVFAVISIDYPSKSLGQLAIFPVKFLEHTLPF